MKWLYPALGILVLSTATLPARGIDVDVDVDYPDIKKNMDVDLESRTGDWVEAFKGLRQEHPDAAIFAVVDGQSVDDIVHMEAMPNSTLVKITYFANHHTRTRIVKGEEIEELGHRSLRRPKVRVYWPDSTNQYEP